METVYIVAKVVKDSPMYFAGTALAGSAPRWSSDYKDAVQFPTRPKAERIVRHWRSGAVMEVDA